jgi:hypothetical protein
MANPDSIFNGQGETLDPIVRPDGEVFLKAAGARIPVPSATDDSAPELVQIYPHDYTLTPTGLALAQGTGTLAAATYFYRVSAITAVGETLACAEVGLAIGATTGVDLTWDAMPGATGYRVYGRSTGAELFIAEISGTTLAYTDSGAITPTGALPTANTARIATAVDPVKASTGTVSSVASSASSVVILAANALRKGATVYNDSTQILYLKLAASAASSSSYTVQMASGAYYEVPFSYSGELRGIWASANGNARVTELT